MELGLGGRAAIVTGATRGIGRGIAEGLAREGAHVLLCARDAVALDAVAKEIGHDATPFAVDITQPGAAQPVVDECIRVFGRVDILVNNAGIATVRRLTEITHDEWHEDFENNFFSAARLSTAAANAMKERGWGRIVHNSSIDGFAPDKLFPAYSAAKSAMISLSKNLSHEYGRFGITSNVVLPGITLTESIREQAAISSERLGITEDEVMARILKKHDPDAGRFGTVEDVANAFVFLCSEAASWITGAALVVDGGTLRGL